MRTSTLMRLGAADPLELALLQHAQQLGLERRRDLADLVEEQRAAVGQLEAALAGVDGAGEGALLVAEQLGLQQRLRQRRAVDLDERPVRARRQLVDGARRTAPCRCRSRRAAAPASVDLATIVDLVAAPRGSPRCRRRCRRCLMPSCVGAAACSSESSFCRRWVSAISRSRSRAMTRCSCTVWPIRLATMVRKRTSWSKRNSPCRPRCGRWSACRPPSRSMRIGTPMNDTVESLAGCIAAMSAR